MLDFALVKGRACAMGIHIACKSYLYSNPYQSRQQHSYQSHRRGLQHTHRHGHSLLPSDHRERMMCSRIGRCLRQCNFGMKQPHLKFPKQKPYKTLGRLLAQQSMMDCPAAQLSSPHTRSPAHSESWSQSPSPRPHWAEEVQQVWSLLAGLQFLVGVDTADADDKNPEI